MNQTATFDLSLKVGAVSESIEVEASAPLVNADSAAVGGVVENRKIVDLPLSGRNPFGFTNLAAGVQYTGSLTGFGRVGDAAR